MDFNEILKKKTVSVEEAVSQVKSGSYIYSYGASSVPATFFSHLHLLKGKVSDVKIVDMLNPIKFDYFDDPDFEGVFTNESLFFNRFLTEEQRKGTAAFIPNHLSRSLQDRFYYHDSRDLPIDLFVIAVSPMDAHGYFTSSTTGMSVQETARRAKKVILEVNPGMPRTFGATEIHINDVDYVINSTTEMVYLSLKELTDVDLKIGEHVASLIEDGSTLQLGIGNIPTAVAQSLRGKKDLGVHTEMLGDGLIDLFKEGIVNNSRKTLYPGKMVTAFSYGTKEAYDFLDNNPAVLHLTVEEVNDPHTISLNEKMISVNTALQVDLMGQCSSEAFGTLQISGTGGQMETARGAKASRGGKSIIALHSTVNARQPDGTRKRKSRIVPVHPEGTVISLMRADTDYVVTEYGIASLRGASLKERALSLIAIAYPDYREELKEQAKRLYLI